MKRSLLAITILIFACIIITYAEAASVPPLINYQGMLTDADGNPLTGTKNLEFNLYDAATGGNKIWGPQIFNSVPLISGQFNVILGTTDTAGRSIVDAFASNNRYLGIRVNDGQELSPRQQILSAPYAIQAGVAETVRGTDLYVDPNSGNVGIGTMNPQGKLDLNNGALVNVDWKNSNVGNGSGLAPDTILCYKNVGNLAGSGSGCYTINFSSSDCSGVFPDESYIGVTTSVFVSGGMNSFDVINAPAPGMRICSPHIVGNCIVEALYIKVH